MNPFYVNYAKAELPFQALLVLYVLTFALYLADLLRRGADERLHLAARLVFGAAWACNLWALVDRGLAAHRLPIKTFHESLLYFCFLFGGLMLAVAWIKRVRLLGLLTATIILGALTFALHKMDVEPPALPPALNSAWFLPHVTIYFTGYSSVTVAFAMGLLAWAKPGEHEVGSGSFWARALGTGKVDFEKLTFQWMRAGWLLLGAGLITGGTWAQFAWSTYWGWDPKENWGLITWLIYLVVLHLPYLGVKRGTAVRLSLAGWGFLLFTYFGMGYLPTRGQSMHVYTEPPPPEDAKDVNGISKDMY